MRTNILHVNRPTPLRAAALRLTPICTDMPNTGPSTRTPPLIKRAAPVTQCTLRYLRREQRREIEEENSSRLIDSNCVRPTDPGSISYTHHLDEISPAQMRPSERASQLVIDCHGKYSASNSPLPREPPSPIVHPRATPVIQRALRGLRRVQQREVAEKNFSRLIDSKLVRSTNPGPIQHTIESTNEKKIHAKMQILKRVPKHDTVPQHVTDCHARSLVRHSPPPCESLSPVTHPRAPLRRTTMSLPESSIKISAATTRLPASAPAGQGSSAAPARLGSAPTSPVGTLALQAIAGSGPGRSRGHLSSPSIPPTMPPLVHMQPFAHLWPQMSTDMQRQLSQISVADTRAGLNHAESTATRDAEATATRDAEATATRHASELAQQEHQEAHQPLLAEEKDTADSLAAAIAIYEVKQADTQDCAIIVGSRVQARERAKAAVLHSSRIHESQLSNLKNRSRQPPPPTSAHPTMAPLPPPPVIVGQRRSDRAPHPARQLGHGRLRQLPCPPTHDVRLLIP